MVIGSTALCDTVRHSFTQSSKLCRSYTLPSSAPLHHGWIRATTPSKKKHTQHMKYTQSVVLHKLITGPISMTGRVQLQQNSVQHSTKLCSVSTPLGVSGTWWP